MKERLLNHIPKVQKGTALRIAGAAVLTGSAFLAAPHRNADHDNNAQDADTHTSLIAQLEEGQLVRREFYLAPQQIRFELKKPILNQEDYFPEMFPIEPIQGPNPPTFGERIEEFVNEAQQKVQDEEAKVKTESEARIASPKEAGVEAQTVSGQATEIPSPQPVQTPQEQPVQAASVSSELTPPSTCPSLISSSLGWAGCAISFCESGWDPNATGSLGERGWFQILPIHADSTYDPAGNVAAAVRISDGGTNWEAWSTRSVLSTGVCPNGTVVPQ